MPNAPSMRPILTTAVDWTYLAIKYNIIVYIYQALQTMLATAHLKKGLETLKE